MMHIPIARKMAALKALQRPESRGFDALRATLFLAFSICVAGSPPAHDIPLKVTELVKHIFNREGYTEGSGKYSVFLYR